MAPYSNLGEMTTETKLYTEKEKYFKSETERNRKCLTLAVINTMLITLFSFRLDKACKSSDIILGSQLNINLPNHTLKLLRKKK